MSDIYVKIYLNGDNEVTITKEKGFQSLEFLSQATTSGQEISYGILEGNGQIKGVDKDGQILYLAQQGALSYRENKIGIFINSKEYKQFIVSDLEYDSVSKNYTIKLGDSISLLKKYSLSEDKFDGSYASSPKQDLFSQLSLALESAGYTEPQILNSLKTSILVPLSDGVPERCITLYDYLCKNFIIDSAYYRKSATSFELIDKICKICQLWAFSGDNGLIEFSTARPIFWADNKIIEIKSKDQQQDFSENVVVKNKYDNVSYKNKLMNLSISETYNQNTDLTSGDVEGYTIITDNGDKYLCFFVTTSSNGELSSQTVTMAKDGIYPLEVMIEGTTGGQHTGSGSKKAFLTTIPNTTKEDYDFSANLGSHYILSYYKKTNSDVIAISKKFTEDTLESVSVIVRSFVDNQNNVDSLTTQGQNIYTINYDNEFLSDKLIFRAMSTTSASNYIPLYDIITESVVADYVDGIEDSNVTVFCSRFYDTNGDLQRDFLIGDTISIGDIVKVNNAGVDEKRWKVTSKKFVYDGEPYIELGLMEVNQVQQHSAYTVNFDKNLFSVLSFPTGYDISRGITVANTIYAGTTIRVYQKTGTHTPQIRVINNGMETIYTFVGDYVDLTVAGNIEVYPEYGEITLEDASWGLISDISVYGNPSDFFSVGDEKTFEIGGNTYTATILGFNHDDLSDNSGKAGITFGLKEALPTSYHINNTGTSVGGWKNSYFRTTTIPSIMSTLPQELQDNIKEVNKVAGKGYGYTTTEVSQDKLWLLSVSEIVGENPNSLDYVYDGVYSDEGAQYEYWHSVKDSTDRADRLNGAGISYNPNSYEYGDVVGVTRSPEYRTNRDGGFIKLASSGEFASYSADSNFNVFLCFCV